MTTGTYGRLLWTCATAPMREAAARIEAGRHAEGVRELSVDNLRGALRLGIDLVAGRSGVPAEAVEALLPMGEIKALLEGFGRVQIEALRALSRAAGGSEAPGPASATDRPGAEAEATADSNAAVEALQPAESMPPAPASGRIAGLADAAGVGPPGRAALEALARDVERWETALAGACTTLDRGAPFVRLARRRKIRIVSWVAVVVMAAFSGFTFALEPALRKRVARARIEATLGRGDPCAASVISDDDLELATEEQKDRAVTLLARCDAAYARAKRERWIRHQEERRRAEEERRAREHAERCAKLADHVETNALTKDDDAFAGEAAPLLRRVASRAIRFDDVAKPPPALPCGGTPGGARIEAATSRALARASTAWARLDEFPPHLLAAFAASARDLPDDDKRVLAWRAEDMAKRAVKTESERLAADAAQLCELKTSLGFEQGLDCRAIAPARRPAKDDGGSSTSAAITP